MYYLELYYTLINTISPGKNKLLAFHRLYGRGSSQYARHVSLPSAVRQWIEPVWTAWCIALFGGVNMADTQRRRLRALERINPST